MEQATEVIKAGKEIVSRAEETIDKQVGMTRFSSSSASRRCLVAMQMEGWKPTYDSLLRTYHKWFERWQVQVTIVIEKHRDYLDQLDKEEEDIKKDLHETFVLADRSVLSCDSEPLLMFLLWFPNSASVSEWQERLEEIKVEKERVRAALVRCFPGFLIRSWLACCRKGLT